MAPILGVQLFWQNYKSAVGTLGREGHIIGAGSIVLSMIE